MVDGRESVTTYKEFVGAMVDLRWLMTKDGRADLMGTHESGPKGYQKGCKGCLN